MATQSAIENISPNFLFPFSPKISSLKRCEKNQRKVFLVESAKYSLSKKTSSLTKEITDTNNLFVERRKLYGIRQKVINNEVNEVFVDIGM